MASNTKISWTDATWNPTTGCDKVSDGCSNCYAMDRAAQLKIAGVPEYQKDGRPETSGPGFGLSMHPGRLDQPIRWSKPRMVFVNSMSDLFHPQVTDAFLAQCFAVMAVSQQHTFQVLTKRPRRARALLSKASFLDAVKEQVAALAEERPATNWPLTNVWLGVSVDDQKTADERIPLLLETPAVVRFLSCEPLLGPVDLSSWLDPQRDCDCNGPVTMDEGQHCGQCRCLDQPRIDQVIVGGESGAGNIRAMDFAWATDLRDQCVAADVAFHFKQLGRLLNESLGGHGKGTDQSLWPQPMPQEYPRS